MRTAILTRNTTGDEGTFGTLVTDSGFTCRTGELPWRDNATGTSCVPPGVYRVEWLPSPKFGLCYHVEDVPGRSDVEIHAANWMGDASKGYQCELRGCIAVGEAVGITAGQAALESSQEALVKLLTDLNGDSFTLTILSA